MASPLNKTPWIHTPLVRSEALSKLAKCNIYLKLEYLQPSGSFKSRGIGNFVSAALHRHYENATDKANPPAVHFYSSSGGNAGLGCVHAAVTLGCKATIVVPLSTTEFMIEKLRVAGADDVIQYGESWKEADRYLTETVMPEVQKKMQDSEVPVYVPPFDAQDIWNGVATMIPEILEDLGQVQKHYNVTSTVDPTQKFHQNGEDFQGKSDGPKPDVVICSVGGGGLFSGIMQGLDEAGLSSTRVIAMETRGADSLSQAVEKRELITLPAITSIATSLGARTVCSKAFEYGLRPQVAPHVVSDTEAIEYCRRFSVEHRVLVEPACGVCLGPIYDGTLARLTPGLRADSNVVVVVCGGSNISLEILNEYVKKYPFKGTH